MLNTFEHTGETVDTTHDKKNCQEGVVHQLIIAFEDAMSFTANSL